MSNEHKYPVYMSLKAISEIVACCNLLGTNLDVNFISNGKDAGNILVSTVEEGEHEQRD